MQSVEDLQFRLRVLSVTHTNDLAKVKKHIQSILDYDLAIAMDMDMVTDGASPDRIMQHLQSIQKNLLLVKQIGETK